MEKTTKDLLKELQDKLQDRFEKKLESPEESERSFERPKKEMLDKIRNNPSVSGLEDRSAEGLELITALEKFFGKQISSFSLIGNFATTEEENNSIFCSQGGNMKDLIMTLASVLDTVDSVKETFLKALALNALEEEIKKDVLKGKDPKKAIDDLLNSIS